ncbi:unnamed protein product [Caenorhabditis nigoni]
MNEQNLKTPWTLGLVGKSTEDSSTQSTEKGDPDYMKNLMRFDLFYARSRTNHKGWKRQYITPDNKGILDMSIFEIEHFRIIIEFSDGSDQ